MKQTMQLLTAAALSVTTMTVVADESTYQTNTVLSDMTMQHFGHSAKASDIIGQPVKNSQDQVLGRVKDLAVDVEAGRILYVIVSAGGIMGVGGTLQAVPPGVLHPETTNAVIHLDPDFAQLNSQFEMAKWPDVCDTNRVTEIYGQYHQVPYFFAPEYTNLLAPRQQEALNESGSMRLTPAYTGHIEIVRSSKVIGSAVENPQGEKLGRVENLMVNLPAGRVAAVIVSSGGFMGMNGELSAIPARAFRFDAATNSLQLNATKDSLAAAPHFSPNQWPDVDQPAYATSIYSAYMVTPDFNTNDASANDMGVRMNNTNAWHNADNTAQNVRDRNSGSLTPFDQGNSTADINITAQIRKQIIARSDLSVDARNVKIITRDGKVTLRGPVNTADEKTEIGGIASGVAGAANVDNQLEVKTTAAN